MLHEYTETADGIETTFATNTLGTYLLTELMTPFLQENHGRVVVPLASI